MKTSVFHSSPPHSNPCRLPAVSRSSPPPLLMLLLMMMMTTLITVGATPMWLPDDATTMTVEPMPPPPPPMIDDIVASSTPLPAGDTEHHREPSEAIPMEGSGAAGDENAEDYTDEEKWDEEGNDQLMQNLDPVLEESLALDESKDYSSQDQQHLSMEHQEQANNAEDIYFDTDSIDSNEQLLVTPLESDLGLERIFGTLPETATSASITKNQSESDGTMTSSEINDATPLMMNTTQSPLNPSSSEATSQPIAAITPHQTHAPPTSDVSPPSEYERPAKDSSVLHAKAYAGDKAALKAKPAEGGRHNSMEFQLGDTSHSPYTQFLNTAAGVLTSIDVATATAVSTTITTTTTPATTATTSPSNATAFTNALFGASGIKKSELRGDLESQSPTHLQNPTDSTTNYPSNPGSESQPTTTDVSATNYPSNPGSESTTAFEARDIEPTDPPDTSPAPAPPCLQKCVDTLDSFLLQVTPADTVTPQGVNLSLLCSLAKSDGPDLPVDLHWKFTADNGSRSCALDPSGLEETMEECTRTGAEAIKEFSNQTAAVIRLTIPKVITSDSGNYECVVTASCCEGTEHAQQINRSETAVVKIYSKPRYDVQLAALSVVCLFLLTGILGTAGFQRRRRRKKRVSGHGHVYYEPVRQLHLPQAPPRARGGIDDDDDDFDDVAIDDVKPTRVEIGSVRVNPIAEVMTSPPEVMTLLPEAMPSPPETTTSPLRESRFEFPRPPSDLMKRMSSNVGFD